jgi:hypothetical protein
MANPNRCKHACRKGWTPALLAAGAVLLAGCSSGAAGGLADSLPSSRALAGWERAGETLTFDHETLFNYINGASEYYFTYTFEEVATNRYLHESGAELNAEIWLFAETEDAFGLFSGRSGGTAVAVGFAAEAALESGIRLVFWQDRYYINLSAVDTVPDEDLLAFAEHISRSLPAGGARPAIVGRLPADGLVAGSEKFFHLELAVQDRLWLGGENLLGLSLDTDAVLAQYRTADGEWQLLLVEYTDPAGAESGRTALEGGAAEDVLATDTEGSLLGSVFGQSGENAARNLLSAAIRP